MAGLHAEWARYTDVKNVTTHIEHGLTFIGQYVDTCRENDIQSVGSLLGGVLPTTVRRGVKCSNPDLHALGCCVIT
jgi:hypothetical protein